METLFSLKQIIFNLTKENLITSVQQTIELLDTNFPYSFNLAVSHIVYVTFCLQNNISEILLDYIVLLQAEEEKVNKSYPKIIDVFYDYIKNKTGEAYYLIEKMIQQNLINKNITKKMRTKYFAHYKTKNEYEMRYYEELSKNDWELHKKLIEEGINPNEITKIIRNDEIEKLQEISSRNDFDFNQTIEPSLYERCSFINKDNVSLTDYAAFFGSVKCFKFLLMNGADVTNTGGYAIAGGNLEIIHLCEQNHSSFVSAYQTAIEFHRNDIFKYIYEKKFAELDYLGHLGIKCILYCNFEILHFLEEQGMKINNNIINKTAEIGNLYLIKYFLQENQIPKHILIFASCSGNVELIKYILEHKGIDINTTCVYFNNLIFQENIWNIFKLFYTTLMCASKNGYVNIVKLLLEQEGININAKDIYLFYLLFI